MTSNPTGNQRVQITEEEFHQRLRAQNVPRDKILLKCPLCGTLQSLDDLNKATPETDPKENEKSFGFSCVGRLTHQLPPPKAEDKGTQVGCNWTLGGLLKFHELEVISSNQQIPIPIFEPATPEEVKAHYENLQPT